MKDGQMSDSEEQFKEHTFKGEPIFERVLETISRSPTKPEREKDPVVIARRSAMLTAKLIECLKAKGILDDPDIDSILSHFVG